MRNPSSSSSTTKTPCCSKVGIKKGPWTAEEDEILADYVKREGEGGWRTLPKRAGLLRCGKSCRLRWMNYLRPCIKRGAIAPDEEDLILRLHRLLGNRWSLIAGRIPGRTDNEIKNYWNTHLSKKLISQGIDPRTHKPLSPHPNSQNSTTHKPSLAPNPNSNPNPGPNYPLQIDKEPSTSYGEATNGKNGRHVNQNPNAKPIPSCPSRFDVESSRSCDARNGGESTGDLIQNGTPFMHARDDNSGQNCDELMGGCSSHHGNNIEAGFECFDYDHQQQQQQLPNTVLQSMNYLPTFSSLPGFDQSSSSAWEAATTVPTTATFSAGQIVDQDKPAK
ncbi:hypothetical protein Ancab_030880 [Ancistrocladus abbreviatus]